jgi:branched-chain amino acid transport system permease protein
MDRLVVSVIGGASLGGVYALIGLGLVLVFRATATLNFAHGEFMLLPAFLVGWWQASHPTNIGPGFVIAGVVAALIGTFFYLTVMRRATGLPPFISFVATLGLASILDGVMGIIFGVNSYTIRIPGLPHGVVDILGARFSTGSLALTCFTLVLAGAVAAVMRFTTLGTRIRAAGQDAVLASQGGIQVRRLYTGSWAAAGVLAAVAGLAYGTSNIVDTSMTSLALAAFPAVLLGGLDSFEGAVAGGLLVGVVQGFTATYLGGTYLDLVTYSLLLGVLLLFPYGLLGSRRVERV